MLLLVDKFPKDRLYVCQPGRMEDSGRDRGLTRLHVCACVRAMHRESDETIERSRVSCGFRLETHMNVHACTQTDMSWREEASELGGKGVDREARAVRVQVQLGLLS